MNVGEIASMFWNLTLFTGGILILFVLLQTITFRCAICDSWDWVWNWDKHKHTLKDFKKYREHIRRHMKRIKKLPYSKLTNEERFMSKGLKNFGDKK